MFWKSKKEKLREKFKSSHIEITRDYINISGCRDSIKEILDYWFAREEHSEGRHFRSISKVGEHYNYIASAVDYILLMDRKRILNLKGLGFDNLSDLVDSFLDAEGKGNFIRPMPIGSRDFTIHRDKQGIAFRKRIMVEVDKILKEDKYHRINQIVSNYKGKKTLELKKREKALEQTLSEHKVKFKEEFEQKLNEYKVTLKAESEKRIEEESKQNASILAKEILEELAPRKAKEIVSKKSAKIIKEKALNLAKKIISEEEKNQEIIKQIAYEKAKEDSKSIINKEVKIQSEKKAQKIVLEKEQKLIKQLAKEEVSKNRQALINELAEEKAKGYYQEAQNFVIQKSETTIEQEVQKRVEKRAKEMANQTLKKLGFDFEI